MRTIFLYAQSVVGVATMLYWLLQGYHRRRPFWTRDSWMRFIAACTFGLLVALAPIGLELAEAREILATRDMSADDRSLWALGMVALMLIGTAVLVLSVGWFAHGEARRPFPSLRHRERAVR
jgi:hypothetical protein